MKNPNPLISHLRTSFCALVIIGLPLAFPSAEASGPPLPARGEFFLCFNYAGPPRQVGENLIIMFNVSGTLTGTFTGSFVGTELDVVHRDGSITKQGSFVFTGSVTGRPGTGTLHVTFEGIGNAVTGHEVLRAVGREGTGALSGVYMEVTVEGDVGAPKPGCNFSGAGTYTDRFCLPPKLIPQNAQLAKSRHASRRGARLFENSRTLGCFATVNPLPRYFCLDLV